MEKTDYCSNINQYYNLINVGIDVLPILLSDFQSGSKTINEIRKELLKILENYEKAENLLNPWTNSNTGFSFIGKHYYDIATIYMTLGYYEQALKTYKISLTFFNRENITETYETFQKSDDTVLKNTTLSELQTAHDRIINDIKHNITLCTNKQDSNNDFLMGY